MVAGLVAAAAVAPDLWRGGYSPDEEFTIFAVRGIQARHLPLLPSGLLYDRGLAYSYASAALAGLGLDVLPAGRLVSVASALGALAVIVTGLRRVSTPGVAVGAAALAAVSVPFWVSATTARFYSPFLFTYLLALVLMSGASSTWRGLLGLACAAACARWTHELAFTLAGVPVLAALLDARVRRATWAGRAAAVVAGLAAAQAVLFLAHGLAPPSNGDVMVKRFFLWQVLNLFEVPPMDLPRTLPGAAAAGAAVAVGLACVRGRVEPWSAGLLLAGGLAAALGQLAVAPALACAVLPLAAGRVRRQVVVTGLATAAAGTAFWLVSLVTAGMAPAAALLRLRSEAFLYPLDMLAHLVTATPWLTSAVLAAMLARGAGLGGPWLPLERALHVLWIGWVLWFGVIESGITSRYLLLPVTFMLMALAVDASAVWRAAVAGRRPVVAAAVAVVAATVVFEQWRGPLGSDARAVEARPTLVPEAVAAEIAPADLVAGPDELAALLAAGRLDAWLVLDPFFRERFVVMRDGQATGTYTGAPAAPALTPLLERAEREGRRLIVVDVLKDAPGFGSMAVLVPRQLARENLRGEVLAEAGGFRLVRVVRAPSMAAVTRPHGLARHRLASGAAGS
ncbi:MAG: hypothetical protein R2708_00100 [Vicinamibacterales bacterium]